jgi:2-dehydropantoate 2-reductase
MSEKKRLAIIGTGAVGGYYGSLLQRAGFDVHFLLNSDYEYVQENGLKIDSLHGGFHLSNVQAYRNAADMPRCDCIVVALKTTANRVLSDVLPHLLREDSMVVTLQNGLGSEEEIARIAGKHRVIGGLCFLCSNKIGPGHIRHLDYGLITLGEYREDHAPGGITPRLTRLADDWESAGIAIRLIEDLPLGRWKKLVWNIPFNGLSVLHNTLTDKLISNPETRALCSALMQEVADASAACARPIEPAFIEKMITDTESMRPYAPSMKLDYDRGKPMEIGSIYENPLRAAQKAGVSMPETEKLYRQLLALNPVV